LTFISVIFSPKQLRQLAFFYRFSSRHPAHIRKAFITYIRPTLEFISDLWNRTKKYLIEKLENIQRHFTKRVPSLSHLLYLERLRALELEPLELKRLKFDLMQYYKVLNNLTCIEPNSYFHLHYPPPSYRNPASFPQQSSNFITNLQSSFFIKYFDYWNALPENVRQSSLMSFKHQINLCELSKYLKGSITDINYLYVVGNTLQHAVCFEHQFYGLVPIVWFV